jgi:rSAM/selenodomain-associated transferase 2
MTFSIIIPTLNEAHNIKQLVQFVMLLERKEILEIIVVDGGSTDNTCDLAGLAGAKVIQLSRNSRAIQLNHGARVALGNILYFVHADVKLLSSFVDDILEAISQGYSAGCYRYVFDSPKIMLKVNAFFTRFDSLICRGGDQTLFIRNSDFRAMGGFDESYLIMEEYDFITRLRRRFAFKIIPKNILVSARKYETNSWLRVQIANLLIFIMFFFRRSPDEMKQIYKILLNYR